MVTPAPRDPRQTAQPAPPERPGSRQQGWRRLVKRTVDCGVAAATLLGTAPVLAAVAASVRLTMGRPVLFTQERPGLRGQPFRVFKFRTMRAAGPGEGVASDGARLTPLGRFLRSTSLDELPQLMNVLKGDMSLVGPRPLLTQYLGRYSPEQARRHDVLPGLTGLAQIHGRNATSWEDRLRWDVEYVDTWSLALDARIVLATLAHVLKRDGISNREAATMPEFQGAGTPSAPDGRDHPPVRPA
jgi:lipopolysaccharide/colanic/teichoic acid biosynthesis glycosyltransferase